MLCLCLITKRVVLQPENHRDRTIPFESLHELASRKFRHRLASGPDKGGDGIAHLDRDFKGDLALDSTFIGAAVPAKILGLKQPQTGYLVKPDQVHGAGGLRLSLDFPAKTFGLLVVEIGAVVLERRPPAIPKLK